MSAIDQLYRDIQIDLRNAHFYGTPWSRMEADTGLSGATIKKFAEGATVRPTFKTVVMLAEYAGHTVEIARKWNAFRLHAVK